VPALVIVEVRGGSSQLDEVLTEAWGIASNPPPGNRLRLAGPTGDGWRVISLWDSVAQFEEFLHERLHLTLEAAGDGQPRVEIWDIETVHRFD
jgi:hypothetical protein